MNHGRPAGPAPDPDNCPPDPQETAEAYLLHHLRPDEAEAFEDHYIACARCAAVVEETGRFVAAIIMTPLFDSKPSISTRSWLSVCSRSSLPPKAFTPRALPKASSSSMKMMQGA